VCGQGATAELTSAASTHGRGRAKHGRHMANASTHDTAVLVGQAGRGCAALVYCAGAACMCTEPRLTQRQIDLMLSCFVLGEALLACSDSNTQKILHGMWDAVHAAPGVRQSFVKAAHTSFGFIAAAAGRADADVEVALNLDSPLPAAQSLSATEQLDVLRFFASLCTDPPNRYQSFFSTPVTIDAHVINLLDDLTECFGTQVSSLPDMTAPSQVLTQTVHALFRIVAGPHVGNQDFLADGELFHYVFILVEKACKSLDMLAHVQNAAATPRHGVSRGVSLHSGSHSKSTGRLPSFSTGSSPHQAPPTRNRGGCWGWLRGVGSRCCCKSQRCCRQALMRRPTGFRLRQAELSVEWPVVLSAVWRLLVELLQYSGGRSKQARHSVHRLMVAKIHSSALRSALVKLFRPYVHESLV